MDFRDLIQNKEYEVIELQNSYQETQKDIIKMFKIQEEILNSTKNIRINAVKCNYISPTCLAILSSVLIMVSKERNIRISLEKGSKLLKSLSESRIYSNRT